MLMAVCVSVPKTGIAFVNNNRNRILKSFCKVSVPKTGIAFVNN